MKTLCALLLLASALTAFGQTNTVTIDDLMQSAQDWANDNLDPDDLAALQNTDQAKVRQFGCGTYLKSHNQAEHPIVGVCRNPAPRIELAP